MRSRGWCFTLNNWTDDDMVYLSDKETLGYRYIIFGCEVAPTTGTPHLQGFVYYDDAKSDKCIRKLFYGCHLEPQKGSLGSNYKYTSKSGDFMEIGERPEQGKLTKEKIESIMLNPYDNFHLYNQYRRSYRELKLAEKKDHERKFYIMPEFHKYTVAKSYGRDKVCLYPSAYVDEDVYITYTYLVPEWIIDWLNGFPRREQNGFEFHYVDPKIVYILYSDRKEQTVLRKKYLDYIDADLQKI